jgi:hypothetical protein
MTITERTFSAQTYRFGFNTQEKTPKISPDSYTAEFWQYDSRNNNKMNSELPNNLNLITKFDTTSLFLNGDSLVRDSIYEINNFDIISKIIHEKK